MTPGPEVEVKTGISDSVKQANEMLRSGHYNEVVLDFDVSTDEFFKIADSWSDKGAKITKEGGRFKIKVTLIQKVMLSRRTLCPAFRETGCRNQFRTVGNMYLSAMSEKRTNFMKKLQ